MYIAARLKAFREAKSLSQGAIEKRTGLLRCYISRLENGHTMPSVETLEKISRALEVPMYQLFFVDEEAPATPILPINGKQDWWSSGRRGTNYLVKITHVLSHMSEADRRLLLYTASQTASKNGRKAA